MGNTESGSETLGRGGDLGGRGSTLLPLKHLRELEASNRLKSDYRRLSVKQVPGGIIVQNVKSLYVEQVSADTGLYGKSQFKIRLSPIRKTSTSSWHCHVGESFTSFGPFHSGWHRLRGCSLF